MTYCTCSVDEELPLQSTDKCCILISVFVSMPFKSSKLTNRKNTIPKPFRHSETLWYWLQISSGHRDIVIKKALHYRSQNVEKPPQRSIGVYTPKRPKPSTRVRWRISKRRNPKADKAKASTRATVNPEIQSPTASTRRAVSKYWYLRFKPGSRFRPTTAKTLNAVELSHGPLLLYETIFVLRKKSSQTSYKRRAKVSR